jgi:hypothetical protein
MTWLKKVNATEPPRYQNPRLAWLSWVLAVVTTGLVLSQLISFERFMTNLAQLGSFTTKGEMATAALFLAGIEILSIPVLVRLWLSRAMRALSAVALIVAPLAWLWLLVKASMMGYIVADVGFTGGIVAFKLGAVSAVLVLIWLIVAALSFYNLGSRALFYPAKAPSRPRKGGKPKRR